MLKDIENREDLKLVFESFYQKALKDDTIGHFFTTVIPIDLEEHLPVILNFWQNNLFYTGGYANNLLAVHQHIDEKFKMTANDINIWLGLLNETVDQLFEGEVSNRLKTNALSIGTVMKLKIVKDC